MIKLHYLAELVDMLQCEGIILHIILVYSNYYLQMTTAIRYLTLIVWFDNQARKQGSCTRNLVEFSWHLKPISYSHRCFNLLPEHKLILSQNLRTNIFHHLKISQSIFQISTLPLLQLSLFPLQTLVEQSFLYHSHVFPKFELHQILVRMVVM